MKKIRALLAVLILVCGLLWSGGMIAAADAGKMMVISSSASVKKGEEVRLTFSLDAHDNIEKGINAVKGTLKYDPDVFETAGQADFETAGQWERLFFNPENGQFVLINRSGSMAAEELFTLTLKAAENMSAGDSYVKVIDVSASEGREDIHPAGASVKITALSDNVPGDPGDSGAEEPGDNGTEDPGDSGTEEPEDNGPEDPGDGGAEDPGDNGTGDPEVEKPEMPGQESGTSEQPEPENGSSVSTGDDASGILLFSLVMAAALLFAGVVIICRKKGKISGGIKILVCLIAAGIGVMASAGNVHAASAKGDLNSDGNTDYVDVELLEKHLIGLEKLPKEKWEEADLNMDSVLTVTDLSLLILKIEEPPHEDDAEEDHDAIELKDVTQNILYYSGGDEAEEIEVLDITGGLPEDLENYYALIRMESMPDLYAGIRLFRQDEDTGRVYAELDQDKLVSYGSDGTKKEGYEFPVAYQDQEGLHPLVRSAEQLFREMAADPSGSFELTEDLDASGISADTAAVKGTFTGELNGNGYRILNLPTALFGTLSGADIHDLVIEDADITAERAGILAEVIQRNSSVENVFIVDSSIYNNVDELGAFAGRLSDSSVRRSAAIDVSVRGLVAAGGIAGKTEAGALIENCYVTGKVQGTYDHPSLGSRAGGIAGWHGGGKISRCYTRVQILAPAQKGNGGIIGGPNTGSPAIEYSLSMSTGAGYRIAGFDVLDSVREVYEYSGSDSRTNVTEDNGDNVKTTDQIYDRKFYEETLGFDSEIWNLDLLEYEMLPGLKDMPVTENKHHIPNYGTIRDNPEYQQKKEQAYANMAELVPFSDTDAWVGYGNSLSDGDILASRKIKYVLPLDEEGGLVTGIWLQQPEVVRKIRLVFEAGKPEEFSVSAEYILGDLVSVYRIDGRGLYYQFPHYVADPEETLLEQMTGLAEAYDYDTDIAGFTSEKESRLYRDYYDEKMKPDIKKVLKSMISAGEQYPFYGNNAVIRTLAEERLREDESLRKMLYAYNYFDKWYHVDYKGVILSDLMFFHGEMLADGMNASVLTDQLLSASSAQRGTDATVQFYDQAIKRFTGGDIMDFLGSLSYSLAGYDDPSDWFADGFDGILVEKAAYGDTGRIKYRIWDILNGLDNTQKKILLPILTAPQEDMYLISVPSQLMIGSLNRYESYLNKDGNERQRMRRIAEEYAEKMSIFYGVSSRWMSRSAEILNSFVNIQFDTRMNFPQSEKADAGEQKKGVTREPVMKWVYEATGYFSGVNGSAAYADGTNVFWMWDAGLGTSDYIFFTFSHETAHNQDGRYFYGGAGRRRGTGGEAHADGNIAQEMRDGCMVFNISKINDPGTEMTNNFSYERIDSADKVHSFYREMFETGYVLDYLAAQAFLRMTPEQQAAVAVQAEHTEAGNDSMKTVYRRLTADEIRGMNLKDMEDLWDNRISVRTSRNYPETVGTATDGSYGFESFYSMNWYQSHNDNGSPDTHSFKRLGQEMLGVAGYEKGYMVYMSALSENDLDALRKITGDDTITWKKYKMNRWSQVEQGLDRISHFDREAVISQFQVAFEEDAANGNTDRSVNIKRTLYSMLKRMTDDFSNGSIYNDLAGIADSLPDQQIVPDPEQSAGEPIPEAAPSEDITEEPSEETTEEPSEKPSENTSGDSTEDTSEDTTIESTPVKEPDEDDPTEITDDLEDQQPVTVRTRRSIRP